MNRVKEIMLTNIDSLITPELDSQLRAEFPGLVAGELKPLE
jgi:hypothetical protein